MNEPYLTGKEIKYINQVFKSKKTSGNGVFTKMCQAFFEDHYGFKKALLTTSCTDALEMCAILLNIKHGDEVIIPSYTFVSTALAFVRHGAKVIFADSRIDHPNIDESKIEELITPKTIAIVLVHYGGIACNMDKIMEIAERHSLYVVEDAAHAIDSFYKGRALGSIGHLATFSFHETKNISSGEGGLLAINDERFFSRAEIIWEKGTNRAKFIRGEVSNYEWIDTGSSFLPSEITAAYLWAQLESLPEIQQKRIQNWERYYNGLKLWASDINIKVPNIPDYAFNNGNLFYILCRSNSQRKCIIDYFKCHGITAVFHYLGLHKSQYYKAIHGDRDLPNTDYYTENLLRLPLFYNLNIKDIDFIVKTIKEFKFIEG